jgi:thioredoxin 1
MTTRYAILTVLLLATATWGAAETPVPATVAPTLESTYPGLSPGPLRQARLVDLPAGTILRATGVIITEVLLAARIAEAGDNVPLRRSREKNAPYVVEKMAQEALLTAEARAWAQTVSLPPGNEDSSHLIETYLKSIAARAQVTPEETQAYLDAHRETYGGLNPERAAADVRDYLLGEKQAAARAAYVNSLSERAAVEFSAAWLGTHAPVALDNPVDRARRSGRPSLVDFGGGGCSSCDPMTPLLNDLNRWYAQQCTFVFVSMREDPVLAERYGVQIAPAQLFFNAQGQEVYRHLGVFSRSGVMARLADLGVK